MRRHPRILDATCHRPEGMPLLLAVVEVAAPPPVPLPGGWLDWQRQGADDMPAAPSYDEKAALCTLELRLPLAAESLPVPTRPRADGLPNLGDAQASLERLITELNAGVWPVIAALEGRGG